MLDENGSCGKCDVPSRDELYGRLTALFETVDGEAVPMDRVLAGQLPADGGVVELYLAGPDAGQDVKDRVAAWLDKPNPAFRYRLPREYLDSEEDEKRVYFGAIIGAIEHGAFS